MIENFLIPTPPIAIQQEIVSILDTFTALEADLGGELKARGQQYQNYSRSIFDFEKSNHNHPMKELIKQLCPNGVDYRTIQELGILYPGLSGKTKSDFSDGNSPFVSYVDIFNNDSLPTKLKSRGQISTDERQNPVVFGDLLFTGSSEDREGVGLTAEVQYEPEEQTFLNSFSFGWRPNPDIFASGYLKHLFRSQGVRNAVISCSNGVTRINISKKLLLKVRIPVPPIALQLEIVQSLDGFSELVSSVKTGIPAEITARRQQYEYYRNKLLTFKELKAS
jgi:type I restriction enzyme S subunit